MCYYKQINSEYEGLMSTRNKKFGPRLTISLTSRDYDALYALATRDEVSVSWVVRRAIDEYLDNHRHEAEQQLPLRILQKTERSTHGSG